jgi:cell division protein FtsI (penicillin-binding protein 3)
MQFIPLKKDRKFFALAFTIILLLLLLAKLILLILSREPSTMALNIPQIERGAIYDRNGYLLAEQRQSFTFSLWLPDLRASITKDDTEIGKQQLNAIADLLSLTMLKPKETIIAQLANEDTININFDRVFDLKERDSFMQQANAINLKGLRVRSGYSRFYPLGDLAANLLGYVNNDGHGGDGLEYSFEQILSPPNLGGNYALTQGGSISLTLDINLQGITEQLVKKAFIEHKARSASALIADARTGEILSYVSLPTFDSNRYNSATINERINRPITQAYEPGSVFKIFTIGIALNKGLVDPTERFFCDGYYEAFAPNGEHIIINCQGRHGWQTPEQILANSCNTGTAKISERLSASDLYNGLQLFGFGKKTALPLAGETAGILAPINLWSFRSKPTIAIGQEVAVSAMQILQAATVYSNSGQMIKPKIVKSITGSDGLVRYKAEREVLGEILQTNTANSLLAMLKLGVTQGIARRTYIEGIEIAAKTGTSQTYDAQTGTYSKTDYMASTLAYVPADKPRYIVYVVFDRPLGDSYFGASVVAPLVKDMILAIIPYAGLDMQWVNHYSYNQKLTLKLPQDNKVTLKQIPDFSTMDNYYQMLTIARQNNIKLKFYGSINNDIVGQFPPAGTALSPNLTVAIYTQTKN